MVSKEEEKEARTICAFTNWCNECWECPHRKSTDKGLIWLDKPQWDNLKCEEWNEYLVHPLDKLYRKIRCLLGIHNWFTFTPIINKKCHILRECTRCKKKQEYFSNKDYTKGKWVKVK